MVVNSADLAPGVILRDRADMVAVDEVDAADLDELGAGGRHGGLRPRW
jgi:hypothetical protein